MRFEIRITDLAKEDFLALDARSRANVRHALETHLRHEPRKQSRSRIKKLRGLRKPEFRLRVDEIRVFYDVADAFVTVHAIVRKSKANEWLAKHGVPNHD